jgi:hypothetical protein
MVGPIVRPCRWARSFRNRHGSVPFLYFPKLNDLKVGRVQDKHDAHA